MAWTYSGNPANSPRDEVRFLIGDTDAADPLLLDEEIEYALEQEGSVFGAAMRVARALVMRFARKADYSVGDLSYSYRERAEGYARLVQELEAQRDRFLVVHPYAGGISAGDKAAQEGDPDRVEPAFRRGLHAHPGTGSRG